MMCVWVVARLPQRLRSMFFENFSSLQFSFGDPLLENFSKNVDFSLSGKQCIVLPKQIFPPVLAHCEPPFASKAEINILKNLYCTIYSFLVHTVTSAQLLAAYF